MKVKNISALIYKMEFHKLLKIFYFFNRKNKINGFQFISNYIYIKKL